MSSEAARRAAEDSPTPSREEFEASAAFEYPSVAEGPVVTPVLTSVRVYPPPGDVFTAAAAASIVGQRPNVQGVPRLVTAAVLDPADGAVVLTLGDLS